jgi:hypothetical protein
MLGMLASCVVTVAVALSSCGGSTPEPEPVAEPAPVVAQVGAAVTGSTPEGGNVYLIGERETVTFDVTGIDRLDLIMDAADPSEGGWVARCDHVGGEPIFDPAAVEEVAYVCEGIDF